MKARFAVAVLALVMGAHPAVAGGEGAFEQVRNSPPRLRAFLAEMPKGSDLHTHLSGAVYAETNVKAAADAGWCLDGTAMTAPPCDGKPRLADLLPDKKAQNVVARAVDAQSMRNFVAAPGINGHDQFFNAFANFGGAIDTGTRLAEVLNRAGRQKVKHVEVMITFGGKSIADLAAKLPAEGSVADKFAALEALGIAAAVEAARTEVTQAIEAGEAKMECKGKRQPGCDVSLRFLQQISRVSTPNEVATQTMFGFLLAAADPRVVGVNIVAPEDSFVALRDYALHMEMIGTMAESFPKVGVALHAGELALGLVKPDELRSHIRDAVLVGRAKRIGHGVDIMYEEEPYALLRLMAERKVAVEINLSSNDMILGVKGRDHPFPVYREAGVPVVLSTDDEGVSRIDITHEYQRAVQEQGVDYAGLKAMSRNGLEHAFLPGASLWADTKGWRVVEACSGRTPKACQAFLSANEKAALQWRLEEDFKRFEAARVM